MGIQIKGINHIGIAAKDPQKTKWFFKEILNLPFQGEELVKAQSTNTIMFDSSADSSIPENISRLEILEAASSESPIQSYLDKKGGGIHHIALTVENIEKSITYLKEKEIRLINETPNPGAHNTKIAFIHPKATGGILIELVEPSA